MFEDDNDEYCVKVLDKVENIEKSIIYYIKKCIYNDVFFIFKIMPNSRVRLKYPPIFLLKIYQLDLLIKVFILHFYEILICL